MSALAFCLGMFVVALVMMTLAAAARRLSLWLERRGEIRQMRNEKG